MAKESKGQSKTGRTSVLKLILTNTKSWVVLIPAIILVGIIFLIALRQGPEATNPENDPKVFAVRRDDLTVTVTEGGEIQPAETIEVKNEVDERQMTIMKIVPAGTYITQEDVNNGKVLVELDSSQLEDEVTQREIDFSTAESNYEQAKEELNIQKSKNESDITTAELQVKFALMDLQKYVGKDIAAKLIKDVNQASDLDPEYVDYLLQDPNRLGDGDAARQLKKLNDDITLSEQQLQKSKDTLTGTKKLYDANYVSELELQSDQLTVNSNQSRKEQNELALELYKRYDFPKQIEKLLSDYNEAKRQLERTKAEARAKLAQRESAVTSAKSRLDSRKERLEEARRDLKNCIIKAPAPGLVIHGRPGDEYRRYRGGGMVAEGEQVYRNQTLITLPDTSKLVAKVNVHESSVNKVKPGQYAEITTEAHPDTTLTGKVTKVAPLPDQDRSWLSPDLKVYPTEVSIDGVHESLKHGMSAKVTIFIDELKDILIVPIQAVSNQPGRKICYVLTPDGPEAKEVETGANTNTFVQITDGLEVGDKVMLTHPKIPGEQSKLDQEGATGKKRKAEEANQSDSEGEAKGQEGRRDSETFELTDEMTTRILSRIAQSDPNKAEELKKLKESDPEKLKSELKGYIQKRIKQFRQDRGNVQEQGTKPKGRRSRRTQ